MRKLLAMLIILLVCGTALAQIDLNWCTIDCGGGTSTGGVYTLSGTIGQADAAVSAGGDYTLAGGFWPGTPADCPGDVDGDRVVNLTDLAILLSNFGTGTGATRSDGDLNGDGAVSLTDLAIVLAVFGGAC